MNRPGNRQRCSATKRIQSRTRVSDLALVGTLILAVVPVAQSGQRAGCPGECESPATVPASAETPADKKQASDAVTLVRAIRSNDRDRVVGLLSKGVSPAEPTWDGIYPLEAAINEQRPELVQQLLMAGADANRRFSGFKRTPALIQAVRAGDKAPAMITLLLQHGADINVRDAEGNTPLIWAAQTRNTAAASKLLQSGANPDLANEDGITAKDVARKCGKQCAVYKALLSREP